MKKHVFSALMIALLILTESLSFAQYLPPKEIRKFGTTQLLPSDGPLNQYSCPVNSIYGQAPYLDTLVGLPSINIGDSLAIFILDNIPGSTTNASGITFWGLFADFDTICLQSDPVHFKIYFLRQVDTLVPNHIIDLTLTGQLVSGHEIPFYRFDGTFPYSIELPPEGTIISIVQYFELTPESDTNTCIFHWIPSTEGDSISVLLAVEFEEIVDAIPLEIDWAFCLKGGVVVIPLSDWAIVISIILILGFMIFRFRIYRY